MNLLEFCTCSTKPIEMKAYWGDVEGTLDKEWAEAVGADPAKYVVGLADYGEQHVNIADSALRADDCGLGGVDSLAAMSPAAEMEAAEESKFIGQQPLMITRMVRKLKQRLIRERKRGHPCLVIFTNQRRIKIGQMFGDPETMPGGQGLQHEFSLLLRCVKKALVKTGIDAKYVDGSRSFDRAHRHSFSVKKRKVLTMSGIGEYVRVLEKIPELGVKKGMIDDFSTVMTYAKEYQIVEKAGTKWKYFDFSAKKLEDIKNLWKKKWPEYMRTQREIIERAKERLK